MTPEDRSRPELRIGDAEREAAASVLGEHYAAGRITKDEFDERSARAYAAKTGSELWPLFTDLPPTGKEPWARRPTQQGTGRPAPGPRSAWSGWSGMGLAPIILVAIGLVVLVHLPWPLLLIVGWIWWGRTFRHWSRWRGGPPPAGQASGSRRGTRGSWA